MAACALYAMQDTDLGDKLKTFLDRSGLSMTDIAERVDRLGVEPKGKTVQKSRVWNYVRGASQMPPWFAEAMDRLYPNWKESETVKNTGRQNSTMRTLYDEGGAARTVPLIPPIGHNKMADSFDLIINGGWDSRPCLPIPSFLSQSYPVQAIENNAYAPAFRAGDVIQLRPNVFPLIGRLYAVTCKENGCSFYAACVDHEGQSAWLAYEGTVIPLEHCYADAAIVAVLPQYTPGAEVGTINKDGLLIRSQVPWPK